MKKKQKSSSRESRQEKAKFKRRWGVTREIYDKMICVLADWEAQNKDTRGSKAGLTIEQKVQVTLTYWREYRTQFHIGEDYGVSEATISRAITRTENALAASGEFKIEGSKDLLGDKEDEIIVDVMECEIERPKKNNVITIRVKRGDTH